MRMLVPSLLAFALSGGLALVLAGQPGLAQEAPLEAALWQPTIVLFDDVPMALVPPGCFIMGSLNEAPNEVPPYEVCFDAPFYLDVFEVTHQQFADFGGAAGRIAAFVEQGANLPRERITWFEAVDFCALRGGRLPSEAEWEYAARGPESLVYPWGNEFADDAAVVGLGVDGVPEAVGSRADGFSWVGVADLAGNVFEWTNSLFAPYPYTADDGRNEPGHPAEPRVVRGGAWNYTADWARSSARGVRPPTTESADIGFRCARDA